MKAQVYKSTGSWYVVKAENGNFYDARIKGLFKINNITTTNPVAVGDYVDIAIENEMQNTAIIASIHDRHNYIIRTSPHNKKLRHIVASNLDQVLLFTSLLKPEVSFGFVDRFLVSAEAWHVPAAIVVNKIDTYGPLEREKLELMKSIYEPVGYPVFPVSVLNGQNLSAINQLISHKTTLISGTSGVGKSSFINHLFPEKLQVTQDVSGYSGKGMHTTTFAEMFDLTADTHIIDTPGIKEFGITSDVTRQDLSHYFPEMRTRLQGCKFNNCLHLKEPGCAIKSAVNENAIAEERYLSYCTILNSLPETYY